MYLTHTEHTFIRNACKERNFYAISKIISIHRERKEDELTNKERYRIISPLRHYWLSKKANNQVLVCMENIKEIERYNRYYIKEAIGHFEESIYKLDMIGSDIVENPFTAILRPNKNKKRRY